MTNQNVLNNNKKRNKLRYKKKYPIVAITCCFTTFVLSDVDDCLITTIYKYSIKFHHVMICHTFDFVTHSEFDTKMSNV